VENEILRILVLGILGLVARASGFSILRFERERERADGGVVLGA
jgi:hypothetical protein